MFNANRKRPHFWFYSSISRANSSPFFVEKRRLPAATTARCDCGQPRAARNAQSCQSLSFSLSPAPADHGLGSVRAMSQGHVLSNLPSRGARQILAPRTPCIGASGGRAGSGCAPSYARRLPLPQCPRIAATCQCPWRRPRHHASSRHLLHLLHPVAHCCSPRVP